MEGRRPTPRWQTPGRIPQRHLITRSTLQGMTRRVFARTIMIAAVSAARGQAPASRMGIAATTSMPRTGGAAGALAFLEKAHALGAGGIQTGINGDPRELRTRAEQLGMYTEAFLALPRNGDTAAFERSLTTAKEAGAICARVA